MTEWWEWQRRSAARSARGVLFLLLLTLCRLPEPVIVKTSLGEYFGCLLLVYVGNLLAV